MTYFYILNPLTPKWLPLPPIWSKLLSFYIVLTPLNPFSVVIRVAQFSCSVVSDTLRPYGLKHARPPCLSPTPGAYWNSCPLSQWCHPTVLSSVVPFSCLQSFPASGSFLLGWLLPQVAKVLDLQLQHQSFQWNIQDWFPLGLTGLISLQSKGLSRVFSNTTVQKHQFFNVQLSLWSHFHIHTWLLEKP